MDEHKLAGVCAYIEDFLVWYLKNKSLKNITVFVDDRFSECSKDQKQTLCKLFNELSTKISNKGKLKSDTYDITNNLLKAI